MKGPAPKEGIYALVNAKVNQYAIDTKGGAVVLNPYIGSESQQWILSTVDGVGYHLKNVESGRFLGLPAQENVRNTLALQQVDHKFAWHLKRDEQMDPNQFHFYVPYSKHVVDSDPAKLRPGNPLFVYQDGQGSHQTWILSQVHSILVDGDTFAIRNITSKALLSSVNGAAVSCHPQQDAWAGEEQQFRISRMGDGWTFQHIQSQRYLGIPYTSALLEDDLAFLETVKHPFTWLVVSHYKDRKKFKICLPFTSRLLAPHCGQRDEGTPIHLLMNVDNEPPEWIWWNFENLSAQTPVQTGTVPGPRQDPISDFSYSGRTMRWADDEDLPPLRLASSRKMTSPSASPISKRSSQGSQGEWRTPRSPNQSQNRFFGVQNLSSKREGSDTRERPKLKLLPRTAP